MPLRGAAANCGHTAICRCRHAGTRSERHRVAGNAPGAAYHDVSRFLSARLGSLPAGTAVRHFLADRCLVSSDFVAGAAAPFAFVLVTEQIPQLLALSVTSISDNPWIVLLLMNLLMLFFGMFLDIGAAILILTPLLMPVAISLDIDPVHFGIVIVVNLMLGGLTPPVGTLAFITGTISRTPVHEVFRAMTPLLVALFAALLLITYVPTISLGLGWLIDGR